MFSETFDVMLCDCYQQKPFYFRNIKLKAGQSVAFNFDTVDWTWCQDDFAAIIDSNNKILKKWQFHITEYKPGECPDCHGTLKCRYCHGQGTFIESKNTFNVISCKHCGGTGKCYTCHVIHRKPIIPLGPTGPIPF